MKHMRAFTSMFAALAALSAASNAMADVAPPPNYVERCSIDKVQQSAEHCESCRAWHGDPEACSKSLGAQGYQHRCRTNGASAWSEIWCKSATGTTQFAQPPPDSTATSPTDTHVIAAPADKPSTQVAAEDPTEAVAKVPDPLRAQDPYGPAAPPPRGCGGCALGSTPAWTLVVWLAGASGAALLVRRSRRRR
jgi:hypothetical protein